MRDVHLEETIFYPRCFKKNSQNAQRMLRRGRSKFFVQNAAPRLTVAENQDWALTFESPSRFWRSLMARARTWRDISPGGPWAVNSRRCNHRWVNLRGKSADCAFSSLSPERTYENRISLLFSPLKLICSAFISCTFILTLYRFTLSCVLLLSAILFTSYNLINLSYIEILK